MHNYGVDSGASLDLGVLNLAVDQGGRVPFAGDLTGGTQLLSGAGHERFRTQVGGGGLSNMDVAAQCWISPRTVAFHLRNVFAKTGVTSRGELAQLPLG